MTDKTNCLSPAPSVAALVARLRERGVVLWNDEGLLRYRAASGTLDPTELAALRTAKAHILELLATEQGNVIADPGARHAPFPLTDVQSAYLVGRNDAFGFGGVGCHVYVEVQYPDLDPARVEAAWNQLIARHDMLRVVVHAEGYQQILADVPPLCIPVTESAAGDEEAFAATLDTARDAMGHRLYATDRWPLFELRVSRMPGRAVLHLSMDFLMADWASLWLLIGEFEAIHAGKGHLLPDIGIGFRDYVLAERGLREQPGYQADRAYWLARMPDLPPAPDLPRAPEQSPDAAAPRFHRHSLHLDAGTWQRFRDHARDHGVTPSAAVMAAYAAVLARWSRDPAFTLNLTILNRLPLHPDVPRLVGDFTSVLLLAVEDGTGHGFAARAAALNRQLFEDLDHRLFSGVALLREMARHTGGDRAIMPVVFTSAIGLAGQPGGQPLAGRLDDRGITQTPQVFIDCQAMDDHHGLQVNWDVREGVFPAGVARDMFDSFARLLNDLAGHGDAWVDETPIDLPAEQRTVRDAANATSMALPVDRLEAAVIAQALRAPDRIAVIDAHGEERYSDLMNRAAALAQALRDGGCAVGARVAIGLDRDRYQVAAMLATLMVGATYVPVDSAHPPARLAAMLNDAGVGHILTRCTHADHWPAGMTVIAADAAFTPLGPDAWRVGPGGIDAPAYILFTSGSTGRPKGVVMAHRAVANTVVDIDERFGVGPDDRILGLAHPGFDLSVYDMFGPLRVGGAVVYPDPARVSDPSHWVERIESAGVTIWNSVPARLQMLIDHLDFSPERDLPSLRLLLLSGDWILPRLAEAVCMRLPGATLIALGGATEAAIWSIQHHFRGADPAWTSIPYGRPLANQWFRVLDHAMRDCPTWVTGELHIGGAGLASAYLCDPDLTATRFPTDPATGKRLYRTGDLGRYLPNGEIEFLGRDDTQIKLRGHRIELGEIEAALHAHAAVGSCAVAVAGDGQDRSLVAAIVPKRRQTPRITDPTLVDAIDNAALDAIRDIEPVAVEAAAQALDRAVRLSMQHSLIGLGIVGDAVDRSDGLAAVAEQFRWLARRWIGTLRAVPPPSTDGSTEAHTAVWDDAERRWDAIGAGSFAAYVRRNAACGAALLRGEQDPVALLFPDGDLSGAAALYRDHPMARYCNAAMAAVVGHIAQSHDPKRPLRVLEVGGGTGGATESILPVLATRALDYHFTDRAAVFLPHARSRFGTVPGIRFGRYDVDRDYREQGLTPRSFDVVLAAGVLENARDIAAAIGALSELAAPGGWLILSEPTDEAAWILASQAFMMTPPEDERRADRAYLSRAGWEGLLSGTDNDVLLSLPPHHHKLAGQNLSFFARRIASDSASVDPEALKAHLADHLPPPMIPASIQIVPALPLTANGKVDRQAIAAWRPRETSADFADTGVSDGDDPLEAILCRLWAKMLACEAIGATRDFYALGADSLVMAKMAGSLREGLAGPPYHVDRIPFDTLLREMLMHPSVAQSAAFIRTHARTQSDARTQENGPQGAQQDQPTMLSEPQLSHGGVLLPFGGGEAGVLRIVFHAGLGTMDCFRPLLGQLGDQAVGPLIGIAIADTARYCALDPASAVERIADDYALQISALGHDRVQLIGYCLGGLFATEVARRLTERGIAVVDLVLVSSHPVVVDVEDDLMIEALFVPNLHISLGEAGFDAPSGDDLVRGFAQVIDRNGGHVPVGSLARINGDSRLDAVGRMFGEMQTLGIEGRFERYVRATERAGASVPMDMARGLFTVFRQSFRAARFTPQPYFGDIRFLRPRDASGFAPGMDETTLNFWRQVCLGTIDVIDIAGNHFTCIDDPNAADVAAIIGDITV